LICKEGGKKGELAGKVRKKKAWQHFEKKKKGGGDCGRKRNGVPGKDGFKRGEKTPPSSKRGEGSWNLGEIQRGPCKAKDSLQFKQESTKERKNYLVAEEMFPKKKRGKSHKR